MRQDFFTYIPQFKLMISGNHKPGLRSVDEAIKRRMHLLPFSVTIPAKERDLDLADKLKVEWPGILAWAVEGCLEWQRVGLMPPAVVTDATRAYLESEDLLLSWLEECCNVGPNNWAPSAHLFQRWKEWTEATGEYTGPAKRFSQRLEEHGFTRKRPDKARGFAGLSLNDWKWPF